jgi:hypothetical protein
MTNEQMKAGRFLRWHQARRKVAWINSQLEAGNTVQITTYLKSWRYKKKHIGMFKATKSGAYVQQGKQWVSFDGSDLRAFGK